MSEQPGHYRPISQAMWSARVDRWNARVRRDSIKRDAAVALCRRVGHDYRASPVGTWCYRCCQYFREKDD